MVNVAQNYIATGEPPQRYGSAHPQICPYQTFEAKDGRWFMLAVMNDGMFQKLAPLIDRTDDTRGPALRDECGAAGAQGRPDTPTRRAVPDKGPARVDRRPHEGRHHFGADQHIRRDPGGQASRSPRGRLERRAPHHRRPAGDGELAPVHEPHACRAARPATSSGRAHPRGAIAVPER